MILVWWGEVDEVQHVSWKRLNDKRNFEERALAYVCSIFEIERTLRATIIREMASQQLSNRQLVVP